MLRCHPRVGHDSMRKREHSALSLTTRYTQQPAKPAQAGFIRLLTIQHSLPHSQANIHSWVYQTVHSHTTKPCTNGFIRLSVAPTCSQASPSWVYQATKDTVYNQANPKLGLSGYNATKPAQAWFIRLPRSQVYSQANPSWVYQAVTEQHP